MAEQSSQSACESTVDPPALAVGQSYEMAQQSSQSACESTVDPPALAVGQSYEMAQQSSQSACESTVDPPALAVGQRYEMAQQSSQSACESTVDPVLAVRLMMTIMTTSRTLTMMSLLPAVNTMILTRKYKGFFSVYIFVDSI